LISTGGMLENCVKVADGLTAEGLQIKVISMHTVKPLDQAAVLQAAASTGVILTVEEHSEIGGLGSAVGDVLLHAGYSGIFRKVALPDRFTAVAGDYEYLRALGGLDVAGIANAVRKAVHSSPPRRAVHTVAQTAVA
jgi:transketolase